MDTVLESELSGNLENVTKNLELRNIFIRYNSVLPIGASVEKLVKIASSSPRRLNSGDDLFDALLLSKTNVKYTVLDC